MSGPGRSRSQPPPAGGSRAPGDARNEAEKWFLPFIIDLDTYRNGYTVLEIILFVLQLLRACDYAGVALQISFGKSRSTKA